MVWQDILIAVGGFGFSIALLPSVLGKAKPAKPTCLVTGAILASYVPALVTLGLWLSAGATLISTTMWFILFFQRRER
jgi:hypothetical protein